MMKLMIRHTCDPTTVMNVAMNEVNKPPFRDESVSVEPSSTPLD